MKKIQSFQAESMLSATKRRGRLRRAIALLSAFVMLFTMNSLKFSADTLERIPMCGYEYDHVHGPECFDENGLLTCALHEHTDACYQERPVHVEATEVETPVEEVEAELGGEAAPAPEEQPSEQSAVEEAPADEAPAENAFDLNGLSTVKLGEIIEAAKLPVSLADIEQVGMVDDAQREWVGITFADGDFDIAVQRDFDEAELGIVVGNEVYTVMLTNGAAATAEQQLADVWTTPGPEGAEAVTEAEEEVEAADDAGAEDVTDTEDVAEDVAEVEDNAEAGDETVTEENTEAVTEGEQQLAEAWTSPVPEEGEAAPEAENDVEVENVTDAENNAEEVTDTENDTEIENVTDAENDAEEVIDTENNAETENVTEENAEAVTEDEQPAEAEENVEIEQPAEAEENTEDEQPAEAEEVVETEQPAETEEIVETEQPAETEENVEIEQPVEAEEVAETEQPAETEEVAETEQPAEAEENTGDEQPAAVEFHAGEFKNRVNDCTVLLSWGAEAEIPDDVQVEIREIELGSDEYEALYADALERLPEADADSTQVMHFFDITLYTDYNNRKEKVEPKAAVSVEVRVDEVVESDVTAIHYGEEETTLVDATAEGQTVTFEADSFSIYGVAYSKDAEQRSMSTRVQVDLTTVDQMDAATVTGDTVTLSLSELLAGADADVTVRGELGVDGETFVADAEVTTASDVTVEDGAITLDAEALARGSVTLEMKTREVDEEHTTTVVTHTATIELADYPGRTDEVSGEGVTVAPVNSEQTTLPGNTIASAEAVAVPEGIIDEAENAVVDAVTFDITLTDGKGEAIPEPGLMEVTVTPANVNIYEKLPEGAVPGQVSYTLFHSHEGQEPMELPIDPEDVIVDAEGNITEFKFQTSSFSEFTLKYTVEYAITDKEIDVTVDFKEIVINGVDFDKETVISALNDGVAVNLDELEKGYGENESAVQEFVAYSTADNKVVDTLSGWAAMDATATEGLSVVNGQIRVTADGTVTLTDGETTIVITIVNYTRLLADAVQGEGVSIDVLEGEVPAGSKVTYTERSEDETAELAEAYEIENAAGAFDVSIAMPEGDVYTGEGQFKVTVDAPEVPEGGKLNLFHIHDGEAKEIESEIVDGKLTFVTPSFSDFVYTVEFHYAGQQVIIQGGTQALLSSLINGLGLTREDGTAFGVDDVENVEFDTPELFRVEEVTEMVEVNGTEVVLATSHDFLITSLRPFKEDKMTLTLTDGSQIVVKVTDAQSTFTSKIKFFAQNASIIPKTASTPMHIDGNLEEPTLTKYYYLLATLYDNDDNKLGWAIEPVAVPDQSTSSEITLNFSEFYQFEEDKLPGAEGYGRTKDENKKISYSSDQNSIETRLYRFDYPLQGGDLCYNTAVTSGNDHPEEGYEFGGNFINSDGINEIHLKKAVGDKRYYVRVWFDEEASTAFENGDRYYVNVKVTHASSVDSFQGHILEVDPASLPTDSTTGLKYVDFEFTSWKAGDGTPKTGSSTTFTGYEDSILVELIHQTQQEYQPNYDQNNAKPIPEGTLAKSYRVHYDTKQTNPKDTPTGFYEDRTTDHVYCYDYIDLMTISATDDYDFNTILGPNVGYGIVADHLFQGNDLQTNFAVNHYSAHGHYVSPDLSGQSSGAIVIGEFNVVDGMAENGTGEVAYDETWGKLPIGNVLNNTLIVYADENTGYNAPDGNVGHIEGKSVIVQHADGAYLSQTMVQPGIDYGIAMSNALMSHPDTFTPADPKVVDTTGFPDGATIYVDGDPLADTMATSGALTIKKLKNQTIVFNFDTSRNLTLAQFHYEQYTASGTKEFELNTSTDVSQTEQNKHMDEMSRHIVWNLNGVKGKTVIKEGGGIYLQPNRNSEIDIQATSGGWIVSNGFVYNSTAEWHNFFVDMPDTNKLNLKAIKTVDGMIPRAGQQFEFFLKKYNPDGATEAEKWTQLFPTQTVKNTNAVVAFPEMRDLEEGWHVYKIHENKTQAIVNGSDGGKYIVDQTDFYALVHVVKTTDNSGTRYIITPPAYYKNFDASKFSKATGGVEEGAFSGKVPSATFDNEAVKEGLTIEKKVVGTTDATKRFTFEVTLTNGNDEPLTSSYQYTVSNVPGEKTLTLNENGKGTIVLRSGQKATIKDLPVGTKYTVTETMVGAKEIVDGNKDANGYVDGYQTPENPVSGAISDSNIAVASFTNVYHAEGTVPLKAKKVMHNASADNEEMPLQEGQFKFTLTPLNSATATPETVTNDKHGNVHFTELNFTEADMTGAVVLPNGTRTKTLIYYVTESDGELTNFNYGNVTYDSNKVVLIILTDDGEGHITAKSNLDEFTVGINNTYEYKAPAHLEANKKLTGRDMKAGEFTFTARLFKTEVNSVTKTYPTNETVTEGTNQYKDGQQIMAEKPNPDYVTEAYNTPTKLTATNATAADDGANPPVSRSTVTFPTVYYTEPGVYYYQITENTGAGDLPMGVTAVEPAKTFYAKVTVPAKNGRTEHSESTVEYFTDADCNVSANLNDVLFENTQDNINFTVTKSWTDANGAQKNAGYSIVFSVKQNGKAFPITQKHLEVVSGEQSQVEILEDGTVKLIGNASGWPVVKIKNVPKATYVVTETEKNGDGAAEYSTTYNVGDKTTKNHATVSEDDSTVTIYNTKGDDKYTTITVEKKWMAGETEYTPTEGNVTFKLTKTETKQVEVTGGKVIPVMHDGSDKQGTVHVGNNLLVSYKLSFGSADSKKSFYNQYGEQKISGIQYGTDASANGDAAGSGRRTVYLPQPCPLSSEEISKISDNDDIVVTFRVPTKGTVDGNTINSSTLGGIKIWSYQFAHTSAVTFEGFSEEPTYDTQTTQTSETFTITAADGWRKVLSGLPLSKSDPVTSYTYTVEETKVNGEALAETPFTVTYSGSHEDIVGGTVVATNTKESVMVTVNKQWKFPNGSTTWPAGVTVAVKLQNKGADVEGKTATLDAEHPSATFDDLDKEGVYTVVETGVTGFTGNIIKLISGDATNGFTITNYATDTDVTVQKTWDTEPTENWTATFKLQKARVAKIAQDGALLATPEAVATETWTDVVGQDNITISKAGPNPVTLTGLPVAEEDGNAVYSLKYQVVETNLTIGSDTTTNRIDPETGDFRYELVQVGEAGNSYAIIANNKADDTKTSLTVNKVWQGGNPPVDASIAVTLGRFKLVEQQPGTITITDSHSGLLSGDTYSVQYTITGGQYDGQVVTTGMSVPAGTYTIAKTVTVDTNRYTTATNISETREITVAEGADVTVTFDGTVFTPITGTLTISDDYTDAPSGYSFSYHITGPYGYDQTTTGTSVSSLPKGTYTVAKTVTAPSGYTITSNATDTQTVEVDGNGGTATMAKTEFEEQSNPVTVTVKAPIDPRSTSIEVIPGTRVRLYLWVDQYNKGHIDGVSCEVDNTTYYPIQDPATYNYYISVDFTVNSEKTIILNGTGYSNWDNLNITLSQVSATSNALTSNRLSAPRTLSKGASRRLMANAAPATTTGEVTVTTTTIIVNNSAADPTYSGYNNVTDSWSKVVTLNNGNWSVAADMLPKADAEGHEYVYYIASVTETNVPTGTTAVITTADGKKQVVRGNHADGDNATLSLTDTLPKTSISANKTWVHGSNPQASQPTTVRFTLFEDGVSKGVKEVTSTNDWTVTWDNLELYKADGTKHSYSVTEENVTDYVLTGTTYDEAAQKFTLTNTYTPNNSSVKVTKVFSGIDALPNGFKITNSFNNAEFTVANKSGGTGTEDDPYYWQIDDVPVGTVVTFTETGYTDATGEYEVVATAKSSTDSAFAARTSASATSVAGSVAVAELKNEYTRQTGSLKITKTVKVGNTIAFELTDDVLKHLADGDYTFAVYTDSACTNAAAKADGTPVGAVTITITNGEANTAEVTYLLPGTYYVKETGTPKASIAVDSEAKQVTVTGKQQGDSVTAAGIANITNVYPLTEVPVMKIWDPMKPDFVTGVEFTLYTDVACTTVAKDAAGVDVAPVTLDDSNSWKHTFTNLPEKDATGAEIQYFINETKVTYTSSASSINITGEDIAKLFAIEKGTEDETVGDATVGDATVGDATTTYKTITNTTHTATITIAKVKKGTTTPLTGAKFQLTRQLPGETVPSKFENEAFDEESGKKTGPVEINDATTGAIQLNGLLPGTYTVTEAKAPAGYIITVSPFTFTINADGTVSYDKTGNDGNGLVTYVPADDTTPAKFRVENEPGAALPATGGVGTGVVYGAGAALVLLALLGFILNARKRSRGEGI